MKLFRSMIGMLEVQLTSGDIGRTFCMAADYQIPLYHVRTWGSISARFQVSRRDLRRLTWICHKRGDELKVLRRLGIYWDIAALARRPVFMTGILLLLGFFLFLPSRILFIQTEGNHRIPERQLLEAAEACGLRFGASRKALRSEQIKNSLLQQLPALSWAGLNTRGCTATLTVRERTAEAKQPVSSGISGISAVRDGIISSCTALRGTLLCRPGQAVSQGQLLISGYTDCGGLIKASRAEGEVFADTNRSLCAISPDQKTVRRKKVAKKRGWGLLIGKKRINFHRNSGIYDTSCDRMYAEYYITLPGGYVLPIALTLDEYILYDSAVSLSHPAEAEHALTFFSHSYLRNQMIAGTILSSRYQFSKARGVYCLQGQYLCREMIGRSKQEKIGE